jgi:HK97 family phage prohead protease
MKTYLTKSAPAAKKTPEIELDQQIMVKFQPASEAELKALGDSLPEGYIAGWASTADLDSYRHIVAAGAFTESIARKGLTGPKGIKLLLNHNWRQVAGVIRVLEYRGDRLWIEAQLDLSISYAKDAYQACKIVGGLNFSVGFFVDEYEVKQDEHKHDYYVITKGDLFEVSVVPFPGNAEATMEFVKDRGGAAPTTVAEFEKALVAKGLVTSRSEAHRITLAVKEALHLFTPEASPPQEVKETPALMLDASKIDKAQSLVNDLKALVGL